MPVGAAIAHPNRVILSSVVEREYRDMLFRPKFDHIVGRERRQSILDLVIVASEQVEPVEPVRACADPNDDKYLALAAADRADWIVSGDAAHLLPMHLWRGIAIRRAATFLRLATGG